MTASIWVFSEKPALLAELIGGGRSLAGGDAAVTAVVIGTRTAAEEAVQHGADRVLWLGEPKAGALVEDFTPTLAEQLAAGQPDIILVGSTMRGRVIVGRLAARLNLPVITEVKEVHPADEGFQARHMIFGGGAVRDELAKKSPLILTATQGTFDALPAEIGRRGEIIDIAFIAPEHTLLVRDRLPKPPSSVDLSAAKKVVCPGRGLAKKEDLGMVEELSRLLGAEIGCTRPLAEGLDWLPRERYIGISGASIKPDLYLGVGVSGQVQHTVGITGSRVVVAINKDENAPIMTEADYAVVGDLYAVVPALIEAIKTRR